MTLTDILGASDSCRTEGGPRIWTKLGQCGQQTSQRKPIGSKRFFSFHLSHQGALNFSIIWKLKRLFWPCLSMNQISFFFCLKGDQKLSRHQLKKIWIGPFFDPFGPSFAKKHLYSAWPHGLAKIAIFFKTSKSSDNYSYFRLIMLISWAK